MDLVVRIPQAYFVTKSSYFLTGTLLNLFDNSVRSMVEQPKGQQRTSVVSDVTRAQFDSDLFDFVLNLPASLEQLVEKEKANVGDSGSRTSSRSSASSQAQLLILGLEIELLGFDEDQRPHSVGTAHYDINLSSFVRLLTTGHLSCKLIVLGSDSERLTSPGAETAVVARLDVDISLPAVAKASHASPSPSQVLQDALTSRGKQSTSLDQAQLSPFTVHGGDGYVSLLVHRATGLPTDADDQEPNAFVTATLPATPKKGASTKQIKSSCDPVWNHTLFLPILEHEFEQGLLLSVVNQRDKALLTSALLPLATLVREQQFNVCLPLQPAGGGKGSSSTSSSSNDGNNSDDDDEDGNTILLYVSILVHNGLSRTMEVYAQPGWLYAELTLDCVSVFEDNLVSDSMFCVVSPVDNADFHMHHNLTESTHATAFTRVLPSRLAAVSAAREQTLKQAQLKDSAHSGRQRSWATTCTSSHDGFQWRWQQHMHFHVPEAMLDSPSACLMIEMYTQKDDALLAVAYITFVEMFSGTQALSGDTPGHQVAFPTVEVYLASDLAHISPLMFGQCQVCVYTQSAMLEYLASAPSPFPAAPKLLRPKTNASRSTAKKSPTPPSGRRTGDNHHQQQQQQQRHQTNVLTPSGGASLRAQHGASSAMALGGSESPSRAYSVQSLSREDTHKLSSALQLKLEEVTRANAEQIAELEQMVYERNQVIRQIGDDFIEQRRELRALQEKHERLRSAAVMRAKADKALLVQSGVQKVPPEELPQRYALLVQAATQQKQINEALRLKVHKLESGQEGQLEIQLRELKAAHQSQAAYIHKLQERMRKYDVKTMKAVIKQQQAIIERLEGVIKNRLGGVLVEAEDHQGTSMQEEEDRARQLEEHKEAYEKVVEQRDELREQLSQLQASLEEERKARQNSAEEHRGLSKSQELALEMRAQRAETRVGTLEAQLIRHAKEHSKRVSELEAHISELEANAMLMGADLDLDTSTDASGTQGEDDDWLFGRPFSRGSRPTSSGPRTIGWNKLDEPLGAADLGIPGFGPFNGDSDGLYSDAGERFSDGQLFSDRTDGSAAGKGKGKVLPKIASR